MSNSEGYFSSTLGKKWLMAVTGIILFLFVLGHMVGNLQLFMGGEQLNKYAYHLQSLGPFLWAFRAVLLFSVGVHIWAAVVVWLRNRSARPVKYRMFKPPGLDYAARTMVWTGPIVLAFIVLHIWQLTIREKSMDFHLEGHAEALPNVYQAVVDAFSNPIYAGIYVIAMIVLAVHLYHGLWSLFQTFGWDHARFGGLRRVFAVTFALFIGVVGVSLPLAVLAGVVK